MTAAPDRCPGVFRTHTAADGELARIRVPGGVIDAPALEALAGAAEEFGDGAVEITVRGNLQVRGIAADAVPAFAAAMSAAGLTADVEHDRVRNVALSPLTGRVGGLADLRGIARELDRSLRGDTGIVGLSGRFWFGLDDGRGDVLSRRPDVTALAVDGQTAVLMIDGQQAGPARPLAALPEVMPALARTFLSLAEGRWRIADLPGPLRAELLDAAGGATGGASPVPAAPEPRVGWFDQHDGGVLLGAVVPFGRLTGEQARFAAAVGGPVIITAERELLLPDLTEPVAETVVRVLAPRGFVFDANSPWTRVTACTGAPGCAQSHGDVRTDLAAHVASAAAAGSELLVEHWVGCRRGCGSPARPHLRVEASLDGYRRSPR